MASIIKESDRVFDSRFVLNKLPNFDVAIEESYTKEIKPISKPTCGNVIQFEIPNNTADYIGLRDILLFIEINLITDKNAAVQPTNNVGLINLAAATIFKQVEFLLQQQEICKGVGLNYPYKAYFDTILNATKEDMETWLQSCLFEKDTAGETSSFGPIGTANTGLAKRFNKTKNGATITLCSKLFIDLLQQEKNLINNVPISLRLHPANDKFSLLYPNPKATEPQFYKVNITDASLLVPFYKINPNLLMENASLLEITPAYYTYTNSIFRTFNIPAKSSGDTFENIFQEILPVSLVVGFVLNKSYLGDNQGNPFDFKHFKLNNLSLEIDGCSNVACNLKPNFITGDVTRAFNTLFQNRPGKPAPFITESDFKSGYSIYKFDLAQELGHNTVNLMRSAQTRLNISFSEALTESVTVILYGKTLGFTEIDLARNVIVKR